MTTLDHRNEDLRGRSFAGLMLDQADFAGADLRGVDLSRARLRNSNFTGARLGLAASAAISLFVASLLIVGATGWTIGWTLRDLVVGIRRRSVGGGAGASDRDGGHRILHPLRRGIRIATRREVRSDCARWSDSGVDYAVIGLTSRNFEFDRDGQVIGVLLLLFASVISGGIARVVGGSLANWAIVVVGLTGGFAAGRAGGGLAGVVVGVVLIVLAKRMLRRDRRDAFTRRLVHEIVSRRGTRFTDADLTRSRSDRHAAGAERPDRCTARGRRSRRCRRLATDGRHGLSRRRDADAATGGRGAARHAALGGERCG